MEKNYGLMTAGKRDLEGSDPAGISFRRIAGITATLTVFICVILTLISQIIHPGYNPLHDTISVLVWGPYGWLQTAAFYLLAFSTIMVGMKLLFKTNTSPLFKVGVVMLILMGIGTIIVGLHPTDIPGTPETKTGLIHIDTAAALVFLFPLACFLMAPYMKKAFSQKWVSRYTYFAGVASVALLAATAVVVLRNIDFVGTTERLIMANGLLWVQVVNIFII